MSEKRFIKTEKNCYYTSLVFDNQTQEELGTSKVLELLNHLHEENISLKAKSSSWKITASKEGVEKAELMKQIVSLKEENEQLRKEHQEMLEKYVLLKLKIGEVLNDE